MKKNVILIGDCLEQLQVVPDSFVNLIVTSPPFANQRKSTYGGIHPDDYVDWFLPRTAEFQRVLKSTGSFILNIKEKVVDGELHPYVYNLNFALKQQGWYRIEDYIWHKKNSMPGKWTTRFRDAWEHCFHFTKQKTFKMNQDAVRVPIGEWSKKRFENPSINDNIRVSSNTKSGVGKKVENWRNRKTVYPSNVLHLATECSNRHHSAAFPESLPEFFIKLFTDKDDLVLDPFIGSGTTAIVAKRLGRNYIGIDITPEYLPIIEERLGQNKASLKDLFEDDVNETMEVCL